MKIIIYSFILTLFLKASLYAWPPTHAFELEFWDDEMKETRGDHNSSELMRTEDLHERKMSQKLAEHIAANYKSEISEVIQVDGKWGKESKIVFHNGFYFQFSWDPNCVEVLMKPSTTEELKKSKIPFDILFKAAKEVNLRPATGAVAHHNIGYEESFSGNSGLFLRNFTDDHNNDFLYRGGLGEETINGPTLSMLRQKERNAFGRIVDDYNRGVLKGDSGDLIKRIEEEVYVYSTRKPAIHNQALGLKSIFPETHPNMIITPGRRMEYRAIRMQEQAEKIPLLAELRDARLAYLKTETGPIVYFNTGDSWFFENMLSEHEILNRFYLYIRETGLDFEKYKDLLPKDILEKYKSGEIGIDPFLLGRIDWSKKRSLKEMETTWLKNLLTSPFLRKRFEEALIAEPGKFIPQKMEILEALSKLKILSFDPNGKIGVNLGARRALNDLLEKLKTNAGLDEALRQKIDQLQRKSQEKIKASESPEPKGTGVCRGVFEWLRL